MNRSLMVLLGVAALALAAHYFIFHLLEIRFAKSLLLVYVVVVGVTALFDHLLRKQKDPKRFVNLYMGYSGGKLMLSLFILAAYAFINSGYILPFAISYLVVYFLFTAFEIFQLLRHLKN
ncbi:MAG: hypothetical protein HN542_01960 [Flavobacteriales bacterium]|nr:hypothetical protein [Flavobacteriales bacterium]MBT3964700.1 hypothetical protein [Flavobacteriales bacterium]MBT4706140.1 hypothetical protein [Flavobacteriales bacterium]MBT4930613.1 hypothetical protein [Flavobacteriales bacterium]MBT5133293.1 hypothetical protein [Flavobacteriales bacterium]